MNLKKKLNPILTLILAICFTSGAFAQFTGGGRLGVNFSNLRGESVQNNSMLIGYQIGGFVNYSMHDLMSGDMADILSLQTELTIQSKGATIDYTLLNAAGEPYSFSAKQNFTYAEIPLMAKFSHKPRRGMGFFGEAGVFIGALTGLTIDGKKSWDDDQEKTTDPRKFRQEYSGFDFGVVFGGGATLPFGGRKSPWSAFANIRYALGLMNIGQEKEKTPDVMKPYLEDVKTGTLSFALGVAYAF